jgi:hypothetical protein
MKKFQQTSSPPAQRIRCDSCCPARVCCFLQPCTTIGVPTSLIFYKFSRHLHVCTVTPFCQLGQTDSFSLSSQSCCRSSNTSGLLSSVLYLNIPDPTLSRPTMCTLQTPSAVLHAFKHLHEDMSISEGNSMSNLAKKRSRYFGVVCRRLGGVSDRHSSHGCLFPQALLTEFAISYGTSILGYCFLDE